MSFNIFNVNAECINQTFYTLRYGKMQRTFGTGLLRLERDVNEFRSQRTYLCVSAGATAVVAAK